MLIYLSAPYSSIADKEALMRDIMFFCGKYHMENPGHHIVSPLFNHPSIALVPGLAGDYKFWGGYSRELLSKCDGMFVLTFEGWDKSTGVEDEMNFSDKTGKPIWFFEPDHYSE